MPYAAFDHGHDLCGVFEVSELGIVMGTGPKAAAHERICTPNRCFVLQSIGRSWSAFIGLADKRGMFKVNRFLLSKAVCESYYGPYGTPSSNTHRFAFSPSVLI